MFREGGRVRARGAINPSDHRGAGSSIGHQCFGLPGWTCGPSSRAVLRVGGRLDELLSVAGAPLSSAAIEVPKSLGKLGEELASVLSRVNGFYAFESALHVRASGLVPNEPNLQEWNADDLWRKRYGAMGAGHFFFGEDLFGGQFSIKDNQVFTFDPETGDAALFSSNLEEWADRVLLDHDVVTGFPLAHEWQLRHGSLPVGTRLVPKRPFVFGGEFSVENLYALDAVEAMRYRADIALQIQNLPESAEVTFKVVE